MISMEMESRAFLKEFWVASTNDGVRGQIYVALASLETVRRSSPDDEEMKRRGMYKLQKALNGNANELALHGTGRCDLHGG